MHTISEDMRHVERVAKRVGVNALAREAGVPEATVWSYAQRGWQLKSLPIFEALIAAAYRLEPAAEARPAPALGPVVAVLRKRPTQRKHSRARPGS